MPEDIITTDLSKLFVAVQWRQATTDEWNKTFQHLFPRKNHMSPLNVQYYHLMAYYREWKKVLSRLDDEDAGDVRTAMFQCYNTLKWVPAASSDCVWNYSRTEGWNNLPLVQGGTRGGPKLFFAPSNRVLPTLHPAEDVRREAMREEEEEGSEDE
jgi:hypothetical protein